MQIEPVVLEGRVVRLEPLQPQHAEPLSRVGLDPELWRWIPIQVTNPDAMRAYIDTALAEQKRGVSLPFAVIEPATGNAVGSTRYGNIDRANCRLEIGWTWYAPAYQRTGVNTESKLLLLTHAFETLDANRVELKTDALNQKSRNAILRIGATQEGIFRKHVICDTGRIRDTVYFSIIDSEWPDVKARLEAMRRR